MPLFEEIKSTVDNTPPNQTETQKQEPKSESSIIKTIGQCLTFAPLVFEQFTGQKVPAIGGTVAEIQLALTQIKTMPQIEETKAKFNRNPRTLDREQLEYSAKQMLTYGIILFFTVGTLTSIGYMTVQQLKK